MHAAVRAHRASLIEFAVCSYILETAVGQTTMKQRDLTRAQRWAILGGASLLLSLSMGIRQSWGLFQPHMIRDLGITAADFSLALAIQNIVWGATQPFVGVIADRFGARMVAFLSVLIYAAGLLISLYADSAVMLTLGAGIASGLRCPARARISHSASPRAPCRHSNAWWHWAPCRRSGRSAWQSFRRLPSPRYQAAAGKWP